MSNNYRMSYFMPPIAPIKDKQGRLMTPPTLIPFCEVSIEQVSKWLLATKISKPWPEQVRNSEDIRTAKASLLPYVTPPAGTFTRRSSKNFRLPPSHLVIVDVDGLHSYQEAVENATYALWRSSPTTCTHLCQPQRTGCKGICSLPLFLHDKWYKKYHRKHELGDAVRRDGIQYGNSGFFRNEIQSRFLRQRPREILFP